MKKLVFTFLLSFLFLSNAYSQGPLVLMGVDAEDGGPGNHGPIASYEAVITSIFGNVSNGGVGILVIGGGKDIADDVTVWWTLIGTDLGIPVTFVNGAANIAFANFAGFAMLGIASTVVETASGGLTQDENVALAGRAFDVAAFINGGGGLLGFSQDGLTPLYGYIGGIGTFTVNTCGGYDDILPTPAGLAIGITDALDVGCWHDTYVTFPDFLVVLAFNDESGTCSFEEAAAIGGLQVIIPIPAASIPTLSEWGLIVMAGILGIVGFIVIRRRKVAA